MERTRRAVTCFAILLAFVVCALRNVRAQEPNNPPLTFSKDVAPILQKHCQTCHRPGEAAPFSMLTYKDTKPWASVMKMVVTQKIMPPWYADPQYGHFSNERSLSPAEIRTLATWVNGGAQEGDPKDMPPPVQEFVEGWGIPQPDVVLQLPKPFSVPAAGVMDYQYVIVPTGFKEDKWVQMLEVRPTDRSVVHHIIAYLREPGSNFFKDQKPGVFFIDPRQRRLRRRTRAPCPAIFSSVMRQGSPRKFFIPGKVS